MVGVLTLESFACVVGVLANCPDQISWRTVSESGGDRGPSKHLRLTSELWGRAVIQVTVCFQPESLPHWVPCSVGQRDIDLIMPESQPNATEIKCCLHGSNAVALHTLLAGQDLE